MLSFYTAEAIAAAPTNASIDPALRRLLADRVSDWTTTCLLDHTHLLIVEAGDTEQDIVAEVAFSPLINPLDGERFGSSRFVPHWDWFEEHQGWFELVFTVGNDGFAFVLLIRDADGVDPDLLSLCRAQAD